MPVKISVIIPAHNEENYIRQTLHSLKQQTYQNYETIVVSNGSTDKTEEILCKRVDEKLKYFSIPQANVSLARNYGVNFANGEILLFLDADTLLSSDTLQKINHEFSLPYSVATTLSAPDVNNLKFKLALGFKNLYTKTKLYEGCSGALICRKEDFLKVGGYPLIKVKEHRKLILKLKNQGKYKCINSYVITSMRRFKKWGLIKATYFWLKQWLKNYFGDLDKSEYEEIR